MPVMTFADLYQQTTHSSRATAGGAAAGQWCWPVWIVSFAHTDTRAHTANTHRYARTHARECIHTHARTKWKG